MSLSLASWNPTFYSALIAEQEDQPFTTFNFTNINQDGRPNSRTCVLRGFLFNDRKTNVLLFTTDKRSSKYSSLLKDNSFEACFNFSKTRKQFRLSGVVKFISDDLVPHLDIKNPPKPVFSKDEDALSYNYFPKQTMHDPLNVKLLSPELEGSLQSSVMSLTDLKRQALSLSSLNSNESAANSMHRSSSLNDTFHPPTDKEWQDERKRCWDGLSRLMKKSFKKPEPGSLLNDEKITLLDSISRGVDGTSSGYEQFVVCCMFIDSVDYVDLSGGSRDRRYVLKKVGLGAWKEFEVCP